MPVSVSYTPERTTMVNDGNLEVVVVQTVVVAREHELLGHSRGLVILAGTGFWNRISFQAKQALLRPQRTGRTEAAR